MVSTPLTKCLLCLYGNLLVTYQSQRGAHSARAQYPCRSAGVLGYNTHKGLTGLDGGAGTASLSHLADSTMGLDGKAMSALLSPHIPPLIDSAVVSEGRAFRTRTAPPPFGGGAVITNQLLTMQ